MECIACRTTRWNEKLYFWSYCEGITTQFLSFSLQVFLDLELNFCFHGFYWLSHLCLSLYWAQLSSDEASLRRERLYISKLNIILVQVLLIPTALTLSKRNTHTDWATHTAPSFSLIVTRFSYTWSWKVLQNSFCLGVYIFRFWSTSGLQDGEASFLT